MEKKRYWLKLDKDFLKSPQMKVIKSMPNGKDYIIFYLSLMLESVETIGHLRFSDLVPYNEEMLSSITDTNIDIVRSAVKIFAELGLLQLLDDGTIYMTQVAQMTGKECESAERVRLYRERKNKELLQCNTNVTKCNSNKEKDKQRIETENNKNKQKENKNKKEYYENKELNNIFIEFLEVRKKLKAVNSDRAINMLLNKLKRYDDDIKFKMIEQSIIHSWKDVYEVKELKETEKQKRDRLIKECYEKMESEV